MRAGSAIGRFALEGFQLRSDPAHLGLESGLGLAPEREVMAVGSDGARAIPARAEMPPRFGGRSGFWCF